MSCLTLIFFTISNDEMWSETRQTDTHINNEEMTSLVKRNCETNIITGVIMFDLYESLFIASKEPRAKHGASRYIALLSDDANKTPFNGEIGSMIMQRQASDDNHWLFPMPNK